MNDRLITIINKFCSNIIEIVNRIKFRKKHFCVFSVKIIAQAAQRHDQRTNIYIVCIVISRIGKSKETKRIQMNPNQ